MTGILVTGGTGFVGRFIVENLLEAGYEVGVYGRTEPKVGYFSKPVRFIGGTLEPQAIDPSIFAGFHAVVHTAFDHVPGRYRGGEGDDPDGFVRRNRDGSIALFRAAKDAGVTRVVFLSTRAVYGPKPADTMLTEETEATPDTLYGQVKRDAERALSGLAAADFIPVALRITGVYGPGRPHKWAALFADYLAGKKVASRAGTEVHGADVARAVRIVLERPAPPPILNVSDIMLDRHDLLELVKQATRSVHPLPVRADIAAINEMACARLKLLGWTPGGWPLLEQTVRDMLRQTDQSIQRP